MAVRKRSQVRALGTIFDRHVKYEFEDGDLDGTMTTMVANPSVHNVPTMIGGLGREAVYDFYKTYFIGRMPEDRKIVRVSRTVGRGHLARRTHPELHPRHGGRLHAPRSPADGKAC